MIFLTGATGQVGREVVELLAARGTKVVALVRDPARASWLKGLEARIVMGPITSPETWTAARDVSAIVHCAAVITDGGSWDSYAANIRSTELAAERARQLGVPLVHLSSVAVYGGASTEPPATVGEEFPFRPLRDEDWYGRSKRGSEQAVWREAERGLRAIALRPCVIYGPWDRHAFPKLLSTARRGVMPLFGRGDRPMALVHSRSVAEGVIAALDAKEGWGRSYNITGDAPIAPRDLVAALGRGLGRRIRTPSIPAGLALGAAGLLDRAARLLLPDGSFPGSFKTVVGYWRGGDPYRADAARTVLKWAPRIDHTAEIERLAREHLPLSR